jgi:hypothetical protein
MDVLGANRFRRGVIDVLERLAGGMTENLPASFQPPCWKSVRLPSSNLDSFTPQLGNDGY